MKEFKVSGYVKFTIVIFMLFIAIFLVSSLIIGQMSTELLIPEFILAIFEIYLLKVFIAICKDTFKKIVIDKASGKFILMTAKKEVLAIPFEEVAIINIAKGSVLRGINMGYIKIVTRQPRTFGVTVSNIDKFFVEMPREIDKTLDDAIFYHPKWNNLEKRGV